MQRSRLKNIINKSKGISNKKEVGDPFDEFKKSLPKELEIDDNYRLEAAWKAYGSPKDYKHALWEGLIQPIDETTFKLPSIGTNTLIKVKITKLQLKILEYGTMMLYHLSKN